MTQEIAQAVVLGILVGAIYGLFSVGLSLLFGVMRLVNFAYGDLVMLGMYGAYETVRLTHESLYLALPLVVIAAVPVGVFIYFVFFRGADTDDRHNDQLLISLGISLLLENGAQSVFGGNPIASTDPISNSTLHIISLGLPTAELIAGGIAICLTVVVEMALASTNVGRALRAVVADREMAGLIGIDTRRIFTLAFIVSVALAGAAGVALFGYYPAQPTAGQNFIILGFICVILGGIGYTRGAFVAGVAIGIVESLTATFSTPALQDTTVYGLFVLALLVRPNGIYGRAAVA
jgi:branched-chain amino acid transport system permease protein